MSFINFVQLLGVRKDLDKINDKIDKKFDPDKLGPKKVYVSWEALARPKHNGKTTKFSRTLIIIGIFLGLLLVLMQEYALILLIASLIFVNEAIKRSSPQTVKHEISTHGFNYAGQMYYWHQLRRFFFQENNILCIDTYDIFPGRLFVLYTGKDQKEIRESLEKHISYVEEVPKTSFEKAYDSVMNKLNLD